MVSKDIGTQEIEAYDKSTTQNLTVNDALILIAVCAAKEKVEIGKSQADVAKRIAMLAKKHPIFKDLEESVDPAISKFMNKVGTTTDLLKPASSAANILIKAENAFEQKIRETAFSWAGEIIMPDGVLTEERKRFLDKYALLLRQNACSRCLAASRSEV